MNQKRRRSASMIALAAIFTSLTVIGTSAIACAADNELQETNPVRPGARATCEKKNPVAAALRQTVVMDYFDTPIADVLGDLAYQTGVHFSLNRAALEEAMIVVDIPITYTVRDLRLESALDLMLRTRGLTYDITDEYIDVTTPKDLLSRSYIRLYDCRDLLAFGPQGRFEKGTATPIPASYTPRGMAPVSLDKIDTLAQTITRSVEPLSWNAANGSGRIEDFHGMLIISHTSRTHRQIESLLNTIRETAGLPPRSSKGIK